MIKKIAIHILSVFTFTLLLGNGIASAESPSPFRVEAYGVDSIAGFTVPITSSKTLTNNDVTFTITKPDGQEIVITENSGDDGIAHFNLYDYHTKDAGTYGITARLNNTMNSDEHYFEIFSDSVSEINSDISANSFIAKADGIDKIYVTVKLKDRNGNAIQGHVIEPISSRSSDEVIKISENPFTSESGSIIFALSSELDGHSVYSFYDSTANVVLNDRLEVAFGDFANAGGVLGTAFAAAGEVSELKFEDIPSNINANSDVSFTLSAYDDEGDIVPNYTGLVHFSAEGNNSTYASLPNDYTFDIDLDGGSHTFSGINALNFLQEGTYTIVATDLPNWEITGSTSIVIGSGSSSSSHSSSSGGLEIVSPTPGTYSDKQLEIIGNAPAGADSIEVFDNDQNVGSAIVASDNTFTFQPSVFEEGPHSVFVTALDDGGIILETTDTVNFTIDSGAPKVEDITFSPDSNINTGDIVEITVNTDSPVSQGAVVFNVDIAELEASSSNDLIYTASIQAPAEEGTYPIDVILVDELGNEGTYEGVANLEISADGGSVITEEDEDDPVVEEEPEEEETPPAGDNQPPSDVFGLRAESDDAKVNLNWQPASDDDVIEHYRVYYGTNPTNLFMSVDTYDDKAVWYIPNLQNGTEYFFAVAAVDSEGLSSKNNSSVANSIPFSSQPAAIVTPPVQDYPPQSYYYYTAPSIQDSGPELIWFLLITLVISQLYFKFKDKLC